MQVVVTLMLAIIGVVLLWGFISIPAWIGRHRQISEANLRIVRLLAIVGILIFITWIIALILACVYPPNVREATQGAKMNPPPLPPRDAAAPIMPRPSISFSDAEPVIPPELLVRDNGQNDACANCGRVIGKLETPHVWRDNVVCAPCHKVLTA
jgi:hypothetical protein